MIEYHSLNMAEIQENVKLKDMNTFAVQARAEYFSEIDTTQEIIETLGDKNFSSIHILGGGSNVLLKDDISGLVIKNSIQGIEILEENEEEIYIKVKSGENWDKFVRYCANNGYWDIENLGLIPGTVGGAIIQNAGAYGVEIKDVVTKVEGIDLTSLKNFSFTNKECKFKYRDSIFKQNENRLFITSATFKLNKKGKPNLKYGSIEKELQQKNIENPTIKDMYETVCKIRKNKLPDWKKTGTAGSFFKNPFVGQEKVERLKDIYPNIPYFKNKERFKLSAGWLIENTKINNKKFPGVSLYSKHSLIIVNLGKAKGETIYKFSEYIKDKILKEFGITLEREVRVW